jgi:TonB family protein
MRARAGHRRRLGYAVAVSIALHALVLFGGRPVSRESLQEPAVPPPLVTRLIELPQVVEQEPAPPKERKPAAPRREVRKPEAAKPAPQPLPAPALPREAVAPPPLSQPVEAPAGTAQSPSSPPQPQVASRAAEASTAAQYRMQLIAYAQRNKPPYPRLARENNWAGEVTLEITLRAEGQAELGLRRGSGYEVLDTLALDTYQQALRAVPVPAALRGRQVRLEPLRLVYKFVE